MLISLILLGTVNASANDDWKNRLYCFGPISTFTSFKAELKSAINNDGTAREVYFAKDASREKSLVTEKCNIVNKVLICEGNKVTIKVDISKKLAHRGIWDAAAYTYYDTKVSYRGLFKTTVEEIRCRD